MRLLEIIQPSPLLAPYVKHYWFAKMDTGLQTARRIIPNGSVSLHFHRGEKMRSLSKNEFQPRAFIGGQQNGYLDIMPTGMIDIISISFQPHGAKAFFAMPINELLEVIVSVSDLNDPLLYELQDRLLYINDNQHCVQEIEKFLIKRLYVTKPYNYQRMSAVIQAINDGQMDIVDLSGTSCLSYRQFKRVFLEYVGINPKDFLRIVRFQKMLAVWQSQLQISFTGLAYDCGFYDQPHLIKEFKIFSGYTPSEYLALCAPHSDYFAGSLSETEDSWKKGIPIKNRG